MTRPFLPISVLAWITVAACAQLPDAQLPDAQLPDAQLPDAQLPDAQLPDAQLPNAPSPLAQDDGVVVEPMSYGQVWWQIRARSREELEAAFDRLVALPDAALPTFVEVRLSPAAAEEIGEWVRSVLEDPSGLNTSFPRANELHERGYTGYFHDDPRWGTAIDGRARAGDFYLEAEDLYRGSESAVGWGAWVLWNAGIPAVETVHMFLYLDVPSQLLEQARDVLLSDPEWPRYADQIRFVGE